MGDPELSGPREKLQDDVRFRVLRLLAQNPEMPQRDLAKIAGIYTGRGPYVMKALVETGLIKLDNFTASEDKRRYAYIFTPKGTLSNIYTSGTAAEAGFEAYSGVER